MSQLEGKLGAAVVQALILCVVRLFTIPWQIWTGAALRLAELRTASSADKAISATSEFPVFNWFRTAWDGIIFLSWFVVAIAAVFILFGGLFAGQFIYGLGGALAAIIWGYFAVILMSLAKESLILVLTIALNVEQMNRRGQVSGE